MKAAYEVANALTLAGYTITRVSGRQIWYNKAGSYYRLTIKLEVVE